MTRSEKIFVAACWPYNDSAIRTYFATPGLGYAEADGGLACRDAALLLQECFGKLHPAAQNVLHKVANAIKYPCRPYR